MNCDKNVIKTDISKILLRLLYYHILITFLQKKLKNAELRRIS